MRDKNGVEVDLVYESQRRLNLFEIKRARTPDISMADSMLRLKRLSDSIDSCSVIYSGDPWHQQDIEFHPYTAVAKAMLSPHPT